MKHYINVWCVDYTRLSQKVAFDLSALGYSDIILQEGKKRGEIEAASYYGKSATVIDLLHFLEKRKTYNASEAELIARWQRYQDAPVLSPIPKH